MSRIFLTVTFPIKLNENRKTKKNIIFGVNETNIDKSPSYQGHENWSSFWEIIWTLSHCNNSLLSNTNQKQVN